jgi:hypothetical protein
MFSKELGTGSLRVGRGLFTVQYSGAICASSFLRALIFSDVLIPLERFRSPAFHKNFLSPVSFCVLTVFPLRS